LRFAFLLLVALALPASAQALKQWKGGATPALQLQDVDGKLHRLADYRGKVVLLNFWATWCAPCREEMPAMERLYLKHRERGFVLLAVSVDSDVALVKPFLQKHKLTFPVALDAKMDLANAYGVRALPASFVIDRNGYLAALALGPRAWDNRAANTLVEGLLAQ
jgi:peroxiredoxin